MFRPIMHDEAVGCVCVQPAGFNQRLNQHMGITFPLHAKRYVGIRMPPYIATGRILRSKLPQRL